MTFTKLYKQYSKAVYGLALSYTKDEADAKDVSQISWIKIFQNLNSLKSFDRIYPWIRVITKNSSINFINSKGNNIKISDSDSVDYINQYFSYDEILKTINELPLGYRTIFSLKMEGYKHYEIAEMLQIETVTSKTQFRRARLLLVEKIKNLNIY